MRLSNEDVKTRSDNMEMMKKNDIKSWSDVGWEDWSTIILGNGASIAIHQGFSYQSLRDVASKNGRLATAAPIFDEFKTADFEHVLLACWYADRVNRAMKVPSTNISVAYVEVREALIEAVHGVHPMYTDISGDLQRVGKFASRFHTVVSLNYDLILYWAMMKLNENKRNWFKDAFCGGNFETNWEYLRSPYIGNDGATLVFYPHGSLSLAHDYLGNELKIVSSTDTARDLLDAITKQWRSGRYVPVFVSEGTSKEKIAAIRRSRYLMNVYEKVLPTVGEGVVVYGWSFDVRDKHVLDAMAGSASPPKRLAVSVFTRQPEVDQQKFCNHVRNMVEQSLLDADVTFFDSQSPGCWNNP